MFLFRRKSATTEMTPQELSERLQRGERLLVLDVREQAEYQQAHVTGSTLIPLDQLAFRLDELPKDQPIVALCRSGNRSSVATQILQRAGFNATNLQGGILQWARQGLPVERTR